MHNTKVQEYFLLYLANFDLRKYIHFHTEVLNVRQADDFSQSGAWLLKIRDIKAGTETEERFDGVMLCSGHHAEIYWPTFPGQDNFQGQMVHTHDYKSHKGYENKRVVVIGIGNSGGDVAVELARISEQVRIITIILCQLCLSNKCITHDFIKCYQQLILHTVCVDVRNEYGNIHMCYRLFLIIKVAMGTYPQIIFENNTEIHYRKLGDIF